jgi:hypothetical protein
LTTSQCALTASQSELEQKTGFPALAGCLLTVRHDPPTQSQPSSHATFFIRFSSFFAVTYGKYPLEGLLETVPGIQNK